MTYDGWEHDVKVEENLWAEGYTTAESIERSVEKMRRRQCLHEGDRSDAVLQVLHGATQGRAYPGWEQDVEREESLWVEGWTTAASIKLRVLQMRRSQRLHDGDRSDALLQVLDEATQGLTYPGWEHDVKVEENLWAEGYTTAESIERSVEKMRRRQCLHEGDRSDAVLQVLHGATQGRAYPGWEQDVEREESLWVEGWTTAASIKLRVLQMRRSQRLHDSRKLTDEEAEESARAYDEAQVVLQTVHDRNPAEPHDQNA